MSETHQVSGTTDCFQKDDEIVTSVQGNPDCAVNLRSSASCCSACCECCKCCGCDTWLDILTTAIFLAYSIFLVWLLAHLKGSWYYFLLLIPVSLIVVPTLTICMRNDYEKFYIFRLLRILGVAVTLMSTFTMLTRMAYFHLSLSQTIGTNFVVASLKASILVFLWEIFARNRFSLTKIKAGKDIITRLVLDNVDIFNMIDILVMHSDPAIAEESPIEKAIQAFCTMSFILFICESSVGLWVAAIDQEDSEELNHIHQWYVHGPSLIFQNIPFFIIRIVFWAQYNVYNLGFLAKNGMAIVFGTAEIFYACKKVMPFG